MRVTRRQLKRIIKEERKRLNESNIASALAAHPNATLLIEVGPNEFYEPLGPEIFDPTAPGDEILAMRPDGELEMWDAEEAGYEGITPAPNTYIIMRLPN